MDEERRRGRLRSFALGGLVGASAALAAARRLRPRNGRRETPVGLAAFEEAPCFREVVEQETAGAQRRPPRTP
jgi:hypothetical protein